MDTERKTKDIKTSEPFSSLFTIDLNQLREIFEHMKEHGYDEAQPVVLWKEKQVLIEGHTRLKAALELGIESIPIIEKSFASEDDALDYAVHCQTERRNMTEGDILRLFEKVDQRHYGKNWGGNRSSVENSTHETSREKTAKIIGIKKEKVSQCRFILEKATEKERQSIYDGEKTIYQVYCSLRNYKDKVINKGKNIETEKQLFDKVNAQGFDVVDVEHLNKVCLTLLPHLLKQEAVIEELEKEIQYFKVGEIFERLRSQQAIQEFLSSRFVTDFITVIEQFGFQVKRPPEIVPVERKEAETAEIKLKKKAIASIEKGLLPPVTMLNLIEKGTREIGKEKEKVTLKKKWSKRAISERREQAILEVA